MTMGLNQHDPIIRRRLAQKLEFLAMDLADLTAPTEADLRAYFKQHLERYQEPVRYTFTQIYFDPGKRGDQLLQDAEAVKTTLMTQGKTVDDAKVLGDGTMLQNHYAAMDAFEITKLFGPEFSDVLSELTPDQWHGPVLSGYGIHLVYLHKVSEPPLPEFSRLRERVIKDRKTDSSEELNQNFYSSLRDNYTIIIEEPSVTEKVAVLQKETR